MRLLGCVQNLLCKFKINNYLCIPIANSCDNRKINASIQAYNTIIIINSYVCMVAFVYTIDTRYFGNEYQFKLGKFLLRSLIIIIWGISENM